MNDPLYAVFWFLAGGTTSMAIRVVIAIFDYKKAQRNRKNNR